jgi:DNA-binding transcriptional regulator YbjK
VGLPTRLRSSLTMMSKRRTSTKVDRREAIADAAIIVLAEAGLRGFTHRALDRRLELPDGSTSYYFRTRELLLKAAVDRLLELDRLDMKAALASKGSAKVLLERWLAPDQRARLIARFELFIASVRQPEPHAVANPRNTFITSLTAMFEQSGVKHARSTAITLIAVLEGLLLNELLGTSLGPAGRARAIDAVLVGLNLKPASAASPSQHQG